MASAILVTTSEELAQKVSDEIDGFLNQLSRKEIMEKSLDSFGYILVASDMKSSTLNGEKNFAVPFVGSTWFGPAK